MTDAARKTSSEPAIDQQSFETYLEFLKNLVSIKSVFLDHDHVENCMTYCEETMRSLLPDWDIRRDAGKNLIARSTDFDSNDPAVFLSAHVDTVGANAESWVSSADPFTAIETDTHVIGRGANDCKAGVAFMLLIAQFIQNGAIQGDNIVFLFSFNEEGNSRKTAVDIGEALGSEIPASESQNTLLCLENTVSIGAEPWLLTLYDREPCNVFIEIEGTLSEIKSFTKEHPNWKPVFIAPKHSLSESTPREVLSSPSGHSATIANNNNQLFGAIQSFADQNVVLRSGDKAQSSVITNHVEVYEAQKSAVHTCVFNCREVIDLEAIRDELKDVQYKDFHSFYNGAGSDRRAHLESSRLLKALGESHTALLKTNITDNPGRSDASAFWRSMNPELHDRFSVATIGPGTRSHNDNGILRKTHGPDEGFHKDSGYEAVNVLFNTIRKCLS